MDLETVKNIATIASAIIATISICFAVFTYLNSHLLKQAEFLWERLFECERSFHKIAKGFDGQAIVVIAGKIFSHSRLNYVFEQVHKGRDLEQQQYEKLIESLDLDIAYAVYDSLSSTDKSLDSFVDSFESSMQKIRPNYPVLYSYLEAIDQLLGFSLKISSKAGAYKKLIVNTLLKMKVNDDLQDKFPEQIQSFVYAITLVTLQQLTEEHHLNPLYSKLNKISEYLYTTYREKTPWQLWTSSRKEKSINTEKFDSAKFSVRLTSIIDLKKKDLGSNYGQASNYVGQATLILQQDDDSKEDEN